MDCSKKGKQNKNELVRKKNNKTMAQADEKKRVEASCWKKPDQEKI